MFLVVAITLKYPFFFLDLKIMRKWEKKKRKNKGKCVFSCEWADYVKKSQMIHDGYIIFTSNSSLFY